MPKTVPTAVGITPSEELHELDELDDEEDVDEELLFWMLLSIISTKWKYSAKVIISNESIKYTAAKVGAEGSTDRGGL